MDRLFCDEPFFRQERLLWPLTPGGLSSLQQDFFHRRTKLAEGLLKELHDGPHLLDLHQGAFPSALFASLGAAGAPRPEERCAAAGPGGTEDPAAAPAAAAAAAAGVGRDLLVTLDVRGYAPEDVHVALEGRRLVVTAVRRAAAEESDHTSSSSSGSCGRRHAAAAAQAGFVQSIALPPHLDLSELSCTLTEDGRLCVAAPAARQPIAEAGQAERGEEQGEEGEGEGEQPRRFRSALEFPVSKDS